MNDRTKDGTIAEFECTSPPGAKVRFIKCDGEWYPADADTMLTIVRNGGRLEFLANLVISDEIRIGRIANIRAVA